MSLPAVAELVPQQGEMCLLDRIHEHAAEGTLCIARTDDALLFADASGSVPAWVGLEWMAQCIAVHGGLRARAAAQPPRAGLLLGSRRLVLRTERFAPGTEWLVRAVPRKEAERGLVSFACEIAGGPSEPALVSGQINVFLLDPEELSSR